MVDDLKGEICQVFKEHLGETSAYLTKVHYTGFTHGRNICRVTDVSEFEAMHFAAKVCYIRTVPKICWHYSATIAISNGMYYLLLNRKVTPALRTSAVSLSARENDVLLLFLWLLGFLIIIYVLLFSS